ARPRERNQIEASDVRPRAPDAGIDGSVDDGVRRSDHQRHVGVTPTLETHMKPAISGAAPDFGALDVPLLVIALPSSPTLDSELAPVDSATNGALGRAIARRDFRGGRDETLHLAGGERGIQRVLLVGMGTATDRTAAIRRAGAIAARQASRLGVGRLAFYAGALTDTEVEAAGVGLGIGAWDFKEMKTAP